MNAYSTLPSVTRCYHHAIAEYLLVCDEMRQLAERRVFLRTAIYSMERLLTKYPQLGEPLATSATDGG